MIIVVCFLHIISFGQRPNLRLAKQKNIPLLSQSQAPKLQSPKITDKVLGDVVFAGSGYPNAQIHIHIDAVGKATCIPKRAVLRGQEVKDFYTVADQQGNWTTTINVTYPICTQKSLAVSLSQQFDSLKFETANYKFSGEAQKILKEMVAEEPKVKVKEEAKKVEAIDPKLTITSPRLGQKVRGTVDITGKATPNTTLVVTYEAVSIPANRTNEKITKGEGTKTYTSGKKYVKVNAAGNWATSYILKNREWRTDFKIKVKPTTSERGIFVTVYDDVRPVTID